MSPSPVPTVASARGVTLVELMVALTVLAVLAMVALPNFSDFFERNKVRGAAAEVVALIDNARAEAVKNDLDVNIAMAGSAAAWCVGANAATPPSGGVEAGAPAACDCTDAAQCLVSGNRFAVETGEFPEVRVGALPAAMVFDSTLGTIVPLGTRTVTLTSPNGKYDLDIQINGLGQARMCTQPGKPTMSGIAQC